MKIKTRVGISLIVFIILAVVILFSYFFSVNQLNEIQKKDQAIDDIEKTLFDLYYLENDYIVNGGNLRVTRWYAKYAELTEQLSQLFLTDPSQQAVLNDLVRDHYDLNTSFSHMVLVTSTHPEKGTIDTSQEIRQFSASTLTGQTQTLISLSRILSQQVEAESNDVILRNTLIISGSIAVLMVFVLLNFLIINRSVLRSIDSLENGTKRIGTGDLDTKIDTGSNDELADLSLAITTMASNLQKVLISKSALENEISERKRAEEALRQSEKVLQSMLDATPAGVELLINRIIQKVNHSLCTITGYSEDDLVGQSTRILYENDEDYLRVGRELYERMERDGIGAIETRLRKKDGGIIVVIMHLSPFDSRNISAGVTATVLDITEQKRAEKELEDSKERYRNVVEDQTEFICRFRPDCTHIFVNDAYCRYFNKSRDELIGYQFRPSFLPEDRNLIAHHLTLLTPERPVRDIDQRIIMPDSSIRWQRWSDRAIFDANRNIIEFQSVGRDITEQKILEKEMEYYTQELRQFSDSLKIANRKLNLLSSITRHDISNQLTVLTGYIKILEKKQTDSNHAEYFRKIDTAAQRIARMIRFTKDYEKIGVNTPVWQDACTVIDSVAKDAPIGNIVVKNDLPAGTMIFADPLISKVFYNLMDNAARYGEKITTIQFFVQNHNGDLLVVCEDDGIGVSFEDKERIFAREFGKNTGMGLFLSREILAITGMTIRETGKPGAGARFEISMPKDAWRITGERV